MKALGRKEPASQSNPSDCFASLAMTRMRSLRGLPFLLIARLSLSRHCEAFPFPHWGFPFSSLRGIFPFVIARHFPLPSLRGISPSRHCEARSAEAISGSDRPYDEGVGPKGTSVSVQPLRLLRFARNDENEVIARPSLSPHWGFAFFVIARLSLSRHCEGFPFSSLGGSLFRHCEGFPFSSLGGFPFRHREAFPPPVIARHEVPKHPLKGPCQETKNLLLQESEPFLQTKHAYFPFGSNRYPYLCHCRLFHFENVSSYCTKHPSGSRPLGEFPFLE